jgi:hypothetical protein
MAFGLLPAASLNLAAAPAAAPTVTPPAPQTGGGFGSFLSGLGAQVGTAVNGAIAIGTNTLFDELGGLPDRIGANVDAIEGQLAQSAVRANNQVRAGLDPEGVRGARGEATVFGLSRTAAIGIAAGFIGLAGISILLSRSGS